MEHSHHLCSLHGSKPECNIDRPQLPGFKLLLQSLGYSNTFRDPHPSLNLLLTPAPSSISDPQSSSRSESEDATLIQNRTRRSKEIHALSLADRLHETENCFDDPLFGDAGHIFDRSQFNTESSPSSVGDWHSASGNVRLDKVEKSFVVRNYLPAPTTRAARSICSRPGSWQSVIMQNRPSPLCVTSHVRTAQPCSSDENKRLSGPPVRRGRKRPQSSASGRTCSQPSIPKFSASSSNRVHMVKLSHGISNASVVTVDIIQSTVPKTTSQRSPKSTACISTISPVRGGPVPVKVSLVEGNVQFTPDADPAITHTELTRHYLNIFFDEINIPAFNLLPRNLFMIWAMNCTTKSTLDRIMLYALMSWASLHCTRSSSADHRAAFKGVIYRGIELLEAHHCLQSVHILLFLAFTEYGDHQYRAGSDAFARCVDTMTFLELNVEQIWKKELTVYELPVIVDAECRRRTFWAVFCSDTHTRHHALSLRNIDRGSIGISLPYENDVFEYDCGLETPIIAQEHKLMSDMAHMIQITRIYADILSNTSCAKILPETSSPELGQKLYRRRVNTRLNAWADSYRDAPRTMRNSFFDVQYGCGDSRQPHSRTERIAGLNILYHNSHMELSRKICHRGLSNSELTSHARNATTHALAALRLAEQVTNRGGSDMKDFHFAARGFSTVYAITEAVDIITAVGRIADVLEPGSRIMSLMYSALALLDQLGSWWGHDLVKYREVSERIQKVYRSSEAALEDQKTFFYCTDPIRNTLSREFDLIYGTNRKQYLQLAYPDCVLIEDKDIFEIDTR